MSADKELVKGSTVILVLGLLNRKHMYGYQIIKEIKRKSEGVFNFKEGTLYPILHSLENKGLVESYWQGEKGSRRRKYYHITAKGKSLLKEKQKDWVTFRGAVDKILLGEIFEWA